VQYEEPADWDAVAAIQAMIYWLASAARTGKKEARETKAASDLWESACEHLISSASTEDGLIRPPVLGIEAIWQPTGTWKSCLERNWTRRNCTTMEKKVGMRRSLGGIPTEMQVV
jgi:hypothetical protein